MANHPHTIPIASGVQWLAERYPVWLCDIWGVLHNGVAAYQTAYEALAIFRQQGGTVVLITNAPRPHDDVAQQILRLGITGAAYDESVTSGDVTRALIAECGDKPVFHLGPDKDRSIFAGLDTRLAAESQAGMVVCTGLFDDLTETPRDYEGQLRAMNRRKLPMICANPDVVVERGSQLCYCAGAIGQAYEALGGKVAYAGKPHAPIYAAALARVAAMQGRPIALDSVLAIGDGMETDILGAHQFGIAALFVASGIHLGAGEGLNEASLVRLFGGRRERPVGAIAQLAW